MIKLNKLFVVFLFAICFVGSCAFDKNYNNNHKDNDNNKEEIIEAPVKSLGRILGPNLIHGLAIGIR